MFFGVSEIESVENDIVTLKNGDKITIKEKNKSLFTESPISGSELQENMVKMVADEFKPVIFSNIPDQEKTKKMIDIVFDNGIRLVDISKVWDVIVSDLLSIKSSIDFTIEHKNNETIVAAIGKDKLDAFSRLFGAKDNAPGNSIRNIRIQDIFIN